MKVEEEEEEIKFKVKKHLYLLQWNEITVSIKR